MTIDPKVLIYILTGGPVVFLLFVVLLFIQDPDRAEKVKALILRPLFWIFRWGSRSYMAAEVGSKATEFFKRYVSSQMLTVGEFKVKVKWVMSPTDPVLRQDGTLILRMKETNDQTLNTIAATRVALPKVVCPTLRDNIQHYVESSIDLTLLRNLAEKLGKHARPVFQKQFLAPEIAADSRVANLFEKLVRLDEEKVFVSIFLEECSLVEDSIYGVGSISDMTDEILFLLKFLLKLVGREIGEEIPLEFFTQHFRVKMLLLAKTYKAETEGVRPYVNRVDRGIKLGCDSIYIIAYPPAKSFLPRILKALDSDLRLTLVKRMAVSKLTTIFEARSGIAEIALLRTNKVFGESSFKERLEVQGIAVDSRVQGMVLDVSENCALVDVAGLNAFIRKSDCSWFSDDSCPSVLKQGKTENFLVKMIDNDRQQMELSLKFPENDPWETTQVPKVGDKVKVKLRSITPSLVVGSIDESLEACIPLEEFSWIQESPDSPQDLLSETVEAVIYARSDDERRLIASPRRLSKDPWPDIHKRFPKGLEFKARVVEVTPHFARVALPGGLTGIVPQEQFEMAGYEYADHEANLVVGQVLQVVVTKVFIKRQKIRLALKRNIDTRQSVRHSLRK